jgi:squalene-associated FAD-dependent desaturase
MGHRVAVVGAGWAGLAAAVTLVEQGIPVVVFEAARTAGGRARRVTLQGMELDNGQHVLIGAYGGTLRMMRAVGADPERLLLRVPLELRTDSGFRLKAPRLPAPLHLLWGLASASGLGLRERLRAVRFVQRLRRRGFALAQDETVARLLEREAQGAALRANLWDPLCVSALNTPPDHASAQVFANVLRDTLGAARSASDLLLPRADLGALFPDPAVRHVVARGGEVRFGAAVRAIARAGVRFRLDADDATFSHAIVACAPHHAARLLGSFAALGRLVGTLDGFEYEPIHTCYLQYPAEVRLPAPMLGFTRGLLQWAFDRAALGGPAGLVAAVVSASGPHRSIVHAHLAELLHRELAAAVPRLPPPVWTRVIAEKRATFSCRPGLFRPSNKTAVPGLFLAGDYTASDYPATLESAVRSGVAAGRLAAVDH